MMHGMRMGPAWASQEMFERRKSKRPLIEHTPMPGKRVDASRKSDAIRRWFCIESWFSRMEVHFLFGSLHQIGLQLVIAGVVPHSTVT
jgi:hypothetical protein